MLADKREQPTRRCRSPRTPRSSLRRAPAKPPSTRAPRSFPLQSPAPRSTPTSHDGRRRSPVEPLTRPKSVRWIVWSNHARRWVFGRRIQGSGSGHGRSEELAPGEAKPAAQEALTAAQSPPTTLTRTHANPNKRLAQQHRETVASKPRRVDIEARADTPQTDFPAPPEPSRGTISMSACRTH